jgi:hypothetical protein
VVAYCASELGISLPPPDPNYDLKAIIETWTCPIIKSRASIAVKLPNAWDS